MSYTPEGFSEEIFKLRYAFTPEETWEEACKRVSNQMALAEDPDKVDKYKEKFYDVLVNNYFVPGGRIWYNSGRPSPQLLNCFVLTNDLDSKQGWGNISREMIITSMTGGGTGIDFSDVRPRGAPIKGHRGECPGPVELMELINNNGFPIRAGGARRVALMFSLDLDHPDIEEFLDAKLKKGKLELANVSIRSKRTTDFIKAVKEDQDWELKWNPKWGPKPDNFKRNKVKAKKLWNRIVKNSYDSAEPGFLNWELALKESNIHYIEDLVSTNPCFSEDTLITTKTGLYQIKDLVGRAVEIWNGDTWQLVDNFRVTGENKKLLKIELQDGSYIKVTDNHSFILEDNTRVKAKDLKVNQKLKIELVESNGSTRSKGAYLKGFLLGDGTKTKDRPILYLYGPKFICEDRLINSAREIENKDISTSCIEDLYFSEESKYKRKTLKGLTPKKEELINWVSNYKRGLPLEVYTWDKQSKLDFIAGLFDADGSASDTKNGFLYQLSSVSKVFLTDVQTLLKTIKVSSKLSLMKKGEKKDFNDGYGEYKTKDCWRLTISQKSSILLSSQVKFSRLVSFQNKEIKYSIKPKYGKIVSINEYGIADKVYCCTVEGNHELNIGVGIQIGQCGEIALSSHDCCCLGHLVLPRFIKKNEIDWHQLANVCRSGVRFLDNVLTINHYPLPEMKSKSHSLRRIGMGVTGLADTLAILGYEYGSEEGNKFIDKLFKFISKAAYESSVMLAVEKGMFPECKPDLHIKSDYMKRMPKKIKSLVEEHGVRNCALLTVAPTGTVSILSGNCSSGIEPMFAPAYERRFWDKEERKMELVFHPLFKEFMDNDKSVDHFKGSRDLTVKEHMEVQKIIQKYIDNAVSKTINIPEKYPVKEVNELWLEYLPNLKGTTFYRENTRGYIDEDGNILDPPLKAISLKEAKERYNKDVKTGTEEDCSTGSCDI